MKKLILLAVLLIPVTGFAEDDKITVFGGVDTKHDRGEIFSEIRYHGEKHMNFYGYDIGWSVYIGANNTTGIELVYPYKDWEFGWGIENSDAIENVVETVWKYGIRIEYNINNWLSVGLVHKSNCRDLCTQLPLDFIPHGSSEHSNRGFNYIGFRVKIFEF